MGNLGSCCQPTSIKTPEIIEINKTLSAQCQKDKEKPAEITVYITTGSLNKNSTESHNVKSDEKIAENIVRKDTIGNPVVNRSNSKKKKRKSIEIINQILNNQELERLKTLLFKEQFLFDEMDDSTM